MYKLATRPPNAADPNGGSEGLLKIKRAFGILILVGITWMFGFFAVADARLLFHYMFAVCNSLQGFAIFIFYCVIQKKVRECWWALLTCNLRSLQKSKSLFTDSYDRRRLSSASRVQLDAMRARSNTGISQVSDKLCCCRYPTSFRWIAREKKTARMPITMSQVAEKPYKRAPPPRPLPSVVKYRIVLVALLPLYYQYLQITLYRCG